MTKHIIKHIKAGKATNIDIALWQGWRKVDGVEELGTFTHWVDKTGETVCSCIHISTPDWLGNTDDALSLVPEGFTISMNTFMKGSATVDLYDNVGSIKRVLHKSLATAIVLAVLEIDDE